MPELSPLNPNPFLAFLERQRVLVLDGGLATALESRGCVLDDPLWSARILLERPDVIRQVHLDFLRAGADCITTSSYQASLPGLRKRGLTGAEARDALELSVRLAVEARETFWSEPANRAGRMRPLVAAGIGPYGAYLADGSEYVGRYDIQDSGLLEFHRRRWEILAGSEADLLACETLPAAREVKVLLSLLRETPDRWAWISCSCRDGRHLSDGAPLEDVARLCDREPNVAAVGVNCTSPEHISSLIAEARKGTDRPILVYPNSGEVYDARARTWRSAPLPVDWARAAADWVQRGAAVVGGCCRVGPGRIAEIRRSLAG